MTPVWTALTRDVRHGGRGLRRTPAFTIGAVLTVALTVGATTAMFSVVHPVLLQQLPYRDVARVFWIWSDQPGRDRTPFNVPDFLDYRHEARTLSGLAGYVAAGANLSDDGAGERIQGLRATGNFLDVLGARAALGRSLQPSDEGPEAEPVVVLTESFWRRRFAGDPAVVGRALRLDGEPHTVVGVLAPGFATPILDVEFVVPLAADRDPRRGARNSVSFINGVGRLGPHVSASQAADDLNAIARRLQQRFPVENARKRGVRIVGVLDGVVGPVRTALLTVFAAIGAVLVIACANLANLMLTRALGCRKEAAVRLALGASRTAVVRQLLVEAWLLGVTGGLAGLLLARWSLAGLTAWAPAGWPRVEDIRVDPTVVLFALVVASLAGVAIGAIPALAASRTDVREGLQGSGRGTTGGGQRLRAGLIGVEVALAVVLLVVVTLLAKSFANVQAVDPGFDASQVLSARLTLPAARFDHRDRIVTFQRALAARLASLPQVTHAGAISLLPLSGLIARVPFTVEGRAMEREQVPAAQFRIVSPGYFETARIPVRRGRTFGEHDRDSTRPVAVVNETLARRWLDGLDPIGARLLVDDNDVGPRPIEIVGVVGDVQQLALDGQPTWDLYLPYAQMHPDTVGLAAANMYWIVRTTGDPTGLARPFGEAVRGVDSGLAASRLRPLAAYLADSVASRRFSVSMLTAFAVAALALAATGIGAVVVYAVSQRSREIGIRFALGASRASVVRLVVGHSLRAALAGLVVGLLAAVAATRLLTGLLFGVARTDVASFAQVAVGVAVVTAVASVVPLLRVGKLAAGPPPAE